MASDVITEDGQLQGRTRIVNRDQQERYRSIFTGTVLCVLLIMGCVPFEEKAANSGAVCPASPTASVEAPRMRDGLQVRTGGVLSGPLSINHRDGTKGQSWLYVSEEPPPLILRLDAVRVGSPQRISFDIVRGSTVPPVSFSDGRVAYRYEPGARWPNFPEPGCWKVTLPDRVLEPVIIPVR